MRNTVLKRGLAVALVAAMAIPLVPAYAEEPDPGTVPVGSDVTGTDSGADPSQSADLGTQTEIPGIPGSEITGENETPASAWTLKGLVFDDEDRDGAWDEDEAVLEGIRVRLYGLEKYSQGDKTVAAEDVTGQDGKYELNGLEQQDYRIEFYAPEGTAEDVLYEGIVPEDMQQRIDSGEWDYEILLPSEEDEWIVAVPSVSLEADRELNVGIAYSEPASEETEEPQGSEEPDKSQDTGSMPENNGKEPGNAGENGTGTSEDNGNNVTEDKADETRGQEETTLPVGEDAVREEGDTAVAEMNKANGFVTFFSNIFGQDWSYDVYYVGEDDSNDVTITEDGNLKYQIEFRNTAALPANAVEIRIPQMLFADRYGSPVLPSEIAVPEGTPDDPTESRVSMFNYYVDGEDLVFFNYEELDAGTSSAFQVLYRNLDMMQIKDGTTWSLPSSCTVAGGEGEEPSTGEAEELTGAIDTSVVLSGVTMTPYVIDGKSYSPGLYTQKQIENIINGSLPQEYADNFYAYRYVVWDVKVYGSAAQPWEMYVKDIPSFDPDGDGTIVGFSAPAEEAAEPYDGYYKVEIPNVKMDRLNDSFRVVTAYPADEVDAGVELRNQISVSLHPVDGQDQDQVKSSESSWTWADYEWTYEGNKIGMDKRAYGDDTYASWLNVYKAASAAGEDKGDFRFNISSFVRGYEDTHITANGETMGDLIEGKSYEAVTVDDFVYAYPNTNGISQSDYEVLDGNDYYFTSVRVTQTDQGYDPWEDSYAAPEEPAVGDVPEKGLVIYAMFADTAADADSDAWEQVAVVPWSENGTMTYQFTDEQIARMPWRVKAVHRTTNYRTDCDIDLTMTIRHDSDTFQKMVNGIDYSDKGQKQSLTVENISGVTGQIYEDGTAGGFMPIDNEGNYQEPGLEAATEEMYGTLPMRGNDLLYFTSLQERGQAGKSGTTWNDVVNGRVHLTYNLTAYDGYNVYDDEAISYLKSEGVQSPGRNEVVFYDVLPYGVKFDPSVGVTAGRITSLSGDSYQNYPQSWDQSQVQVTVDSEKDIDTDYKGTGRTMVRFHITYTGADPAVYTDQMWMAGFGISFGAYYDWKDTDVADNASNVAAYMAEGDDQRPFLGTADEVAQDNGTYPSSLGGDTEDYTVFGKDIDGDGDETDTVLYAKTKVLSDSAQAATSGIRKLVRADADRFGLYREQAEVDLGKGYTYDITVSNVSGTMSDIVVFDRLDNGAADDSALSGSGSWQGTFRSVVTTGLEQIGADPVIYYNADRNAAAPADGQDPDGVLTAENGWMDEEAWAEAGKEAADVKAVAVDIRKAKDGGEFALTGTASVTFQIQMTSPAEDTGLKAYNAAGYYSSNARGVSGYTVSDTTEVSQHIPGQFELVKEFTGEVPDAVKDSGFVFTVYRNHSGQDREAYANLEYELYQKDGNGGWIRQGEDQVYATDGAGQLTLKAGQKAVFDTPEARILSAEEEENPFWEQDVQTEHPDEDTTVQTVTNRYRPVLYVTKDVTAVPSDEDISGDTFTFRLEADGEAVADTEFWYVDGPRTDGGIPEKVTELGKDGEGTTDENGEFTIHAGETVALFPGNEDTVYTVTETAGYGDGTDWICEEPEMSGTLPYTGTAAEITNIYKWKDLYLTKELTNQDPSECKKEFTFRITDEDGEPVSGKTWVMAESGDDAELTGETDENGEFSAACAGRTIRIEDLEGGVTYIVEEIDNTGYEDGDYYEPVNKKAEAVMPVYGLSASVTITNDYILRPLSVTKTVNYNPETIDEEKLQEIAGKEFSMKVEIDGEAFSNKAYVVEEGGVVTETGKTTGSDGSFTIRDGQTVLFEDVAPKGSTYTVTETQDPEYPQIYPGNMQPAEGTFTESGASAQIINGYSGTLIVGKDFVASEDAGPIVQEYIDKLKKGEVTDQTVSLTLEVKQDGTETYTKWPQEDADVLVVDMINNTTSLEVWEAGEPFEAKPWQYIAVSGLGEKTAYRLSESSEDQHDIITYTGNDGKRYKLEISQKIPANDQSIADVVSDNPRAVIYNQVRDLDAVSTVVKQMLSEKNPVPEGAQLAYRVERFNGQKWSPAEGIPYIVTAGNTIVSDETGRTDSEGMLYIYMNSEGTPTVEFTEDEVAVHPSDPKTGSLRVVEVAEQTDPSWGRFAGYVDEEGSKGIDVWDASGFVNSNTKHSFEVAKEMQVPTDETFTMILEQITSATASPVSTKDEIRETVPGSGIGYTVYDSETNEEIGTGITGAAGEIYLKAGQYASLNIEDGTEWTVSEKIPGGYTLEGLDSEGDEETITAVKADNNLVIVGVKQPEEELEGIILTKEMVEEGVTNGETGLPVNLTAGDIAIPEKIYYEGEKYYVTGIGESAFAGGTSYDYDTGMITYTSKLTAVLLPDTIKTIEDNAFLYCGNIKEINIPDGVETIGDYALAYVGAAYYDSRIEADGKISIGPLKNGASTFRVPDSVTSVGDLAFALSTVGNADLRNCLDIGMGAFASASYLTDCMLAEGLKEIPNSCFSGCANEDFYVKIPDTVETIGSSAFSQAFCFAPTDLPDSIITIGDRAFSGCYGDYYLSEDQKDSITLRLPEELKSIGDSAFESGAISEIIWNDKLEDVGNFAFAWNLFREFNVPKVLEGTHGVIYYNKYLEKLTFEDGITSIPEWICYECPALKDVTIPDSVRTIEEAAFHTCPSLAEIEIPEGVTVIGPHAFSSCSSLTSITIPSTVTNIGGTYQDMNPASDIFDRCTVLMEIIIKGEKREIPMIDDDGSGLDDAWGAPNARVIWEADQ